MKVTRPRTQTDGEEEQGSAGGPEASAAAPTPWLSEPTPAQTVDRICRPYGHRHRSAEGPPPIRSNRRS